MAQYKVFSCGICKKIFDARVDRGQPMVAVCKPCASRKNRAIRKFEESKRGKV